MQHRTQRPSKAGRPPRLPRAAVLVAAQRIPDEEGAEKKGRYRPQVH
ncbi:hypothetical protein [Streptomyces sp. NPDC005336]